MSNVHQYEYEERYLLTEEQFLEIEKTLRAQATNAVLDNKKSYFFVLPDVNVSIASSPKKTVLKYKGGQIGKGNGFKEYEIGLDPAAFDDAIELFESLLGLKPQYSEQFRINFLLEDGVEAALKYTQSWGFHLELEKVYTSTEDDKTENEKGVKQLLDNLAASLKITPVTDGDLGKLAHGQERGEYSPKDFTSKFGSLFS